jgi:electron transfer flavoprotein alpha/beta subunit
MRASSDVGAVLVHIDLDGDHVEPSSLAALAAGRAVASSWGGTLYAALIAHDPSARKPIDGEEPTAPVRLTSAKRLKDVQTELGLAGADKIVVAMTASPVLPMWFSVGDAWQKVLDHLRPRLVLFGAESPSAAELGPRTGARLGARLLLRARAIGVEEVELRDRDGGYVRASDGGAAVVLVGGPPPAMTADEDIDLVVLDAKTGADDRVELAGTIPAEVSHTIGAIVALGDDALDPVIAKEAARIARLLDAPVVGSANAARANAIGHGAVVDKNAPLAPEVCIAIGNPVIDLAGTTSVVRVGGGGGKAIDGSLSGPIPMNLAELRRALEEPNR